MTEKDMLLQGLNDAGCSKDASAAICALYESGQFEEMIHQMKIQRCGLVDEMHQSQRKVDRMDFLIRAHKNRIR